MEAKNTKQCRYDAIICIIYVLLSAPNPLADLLRSYPSTGQTTLEVMAAPGVTRDQLYTLLDMTPGLEYCEMDRDSGRHELFSFHRSQNLTNN